MSDSAFEWKEPSRGGSCATRFLPCQQHAGDREAADGSPHHRRELNLGGGAVVSEIDGVEFSPLAAVLHERASRSIAGGSADMLRGCGEAEHSPAAGPPGGRRYRMERLLWHSTFRCAKLVVRTRPPPLLDRSESDGG